MVKRETVSKEKKAAIRKTEDGGSIPATSHRPLASITFSPQTQARGPIATVEIAAKDLVRTAEDANGQDDLEEFNTLYGG